MKVEKLSTHISFRFLLFEIEVGRVPLKSLSAKFLERRGWLMELSYNFLNKAQKNIQY